MVMQSYGNTLPFESTNLPNHDAIFAYFWNCWIKIVKIIHVKACKPETAVAQDHSAG